MGGQTTFDEIKVQAHANNDTPTGVDLVQLTGGDSFDANAPVEWYNLQGMRVENPSNGIFIRKAIMEDGSIVVNKIVKR